MRNIVLSIMLITSATVFAAEPLDSVQHIDEVIITGTRNETSARYIPMTVTTVDREVLTNKFSQNILPTLNEQVPNLLVTSRGMMGYGVSTGAAGGMMLRGLSSADGRLMVLIDGHPQYNGIYSHSIADSYQTMMAERVEILRGPASLLYGSNAMGGVINIITRKPQYDTMRKTWTTTNINVGAGSYGTIQTEASNQFHSGKFSSTAAVQYSRSDNHRENMGFEQYGGFAKLGYDISKQWNLYADVDITHFNSSYPGTVSSPMLEADQWITRGAAAFGVENHYDKTNGRISVYDNWGAHKINDGYKAVGGTPQTDFFRSCDALMGVSWFQSTQFFTGNRLTVGIDYQHIYGRAWYENRETGETVTTSRRLMQSTHTHENEIAGYVDIRQDIASFITIDAGLRYDHHSTAGGEWIPQGGFVIRPISNGEIRAMVSKGFRNPSTREMYLYGTANHDSLHAESMVNYEISWKHHVLDGALTYGVNLFYIDGKNIIQTVSFTDANGTHMSNVNTGKFKNKGAEIEASWKMNEHWSINTNHSYLHMDNPLVSAPTYKGYLGASMRYGKWYANAGLMHVNGLYTAVGENEIKETFTILNALVKYQFHQTVGMWIKGDNLLAQRYEYIAGYPMPKATFMAGVNISF